VATEATFGSEEQRRFDIMARMQIRAALLLSVLCAATFSFAQSPSVPGRWTEQDANAWYSRQSWLVGANYVPSDAINQLEMFQAETFNPALNDRELGLAESIGMNTMRVFLQDQLWQQDPKGFVHRLDAFLAIASRHHIRPILVLFDSCWEPNPHLGPQHPPIPGVHNSGWVQSPGAKELSDPSYEPKLKEYVVGIVSAFAKDDRVLAWDIWNEPDNTNGGRFGETKDKVELVQAMLPKVFSWARSAHPTQPLTSGVWTGNWSDPAEESPVTKIQLEQSDIISFHNYGWPEEFEARVKSLEPLHRPILCTEYMARGSGSTFDTILPLAKKLNVAAINWGLVAGKTQTYLPWDSWQHPYVLSQPTIWFHEVFRHDGTPYRQREVDLIHDLTGRGTGITPKQESGS
jgi:hypothetical protein